MNTSESEAEILKLRHVRWKTPLSRKIEEFSEIIKNDEVFEKYFGESYVENLTKKSKGITQIILKLLLVYAIIMLSLYASQNMNNSGFEIFGYGFENLSSYKEFLLFLAAIITPISATLTAYQKYLNSLINECVKKLSPDANTGKFYSLTFLDEYFGWLSSSHEEASISWHGLTIFLIASLVLVAVLLLVTLAAGSFFIQINVIYDVAIHPSASKYMNIFVLTFSISSIFLSWLITIVQLPMPEVDLSNYDKLEKIKKEDPDRYDAIMRKTANDSTKQEAFTTLISSAFIYMAIFSVISIYWFAGSLENLTFFLGKAMTGVFLVLFFSNEVMGLVRKLVLAWYFKNYTKESDIRRKVFARVLKILLLNRIIPPVALTTIYAFYTLSAG